MFSKSSEHAHVVLLKTERSKERERASKKERKKERKSLKICHPSAARFRSLHFRTPNLNVLRTVNSMSAIPHSFFKATIISGSVAQKKSERGWMMHKSTGQRDRSDATVGSRFETRYKQTN
jgi:hypothetical protein